MDLGMLANLGEFIGGLGVIVSVVYLAIQIRGNTSSVRSENYARSLERMASMQELLARDRDFTKIFNRGIVDPNGLSVTERVQFVWVITELFGNLEFMCFQAQEGTIPRELWQRWEETLRWWLTFPGVRACWEARATPFTPTFTRCVERCLEGGYRSPRQGAWERFLAGAERDPARATNAEGSAAADLPPRA